MKDSEADGKEFIRFFSFSFSDRLTILLMDDTHLFFVKTKQILPEKYSDHTTEFSTLAPITMNVMYFHFEKKKSEK